MKAITVPAVDAWAITYAGYRHTGAPWPNYAGHVALHAGADTKDATGIVQAWTRGNVPIDAIIAVAELADGAIHNVRPLTTPVPCPGALGLWNLPTSIAAAVLAQVEAAS